MIRSAKWLVLGGFLAAGLVATTGCERGPDRPLIDTSALIGSWIEIADQAKTNPRLPGADVQKKKYLRYITFNQDNTFEFSLRDKSGKPGKDKSKVEGTWAIVENEIVFKVTNSTFADTDERRDWAPEVSVGIARREVADEGLMDVLSVRDVEGAPTAFERAD